MAFIWSGIRVVYDEGHLEDVAKPLIEKQIGVEEHNFIFWNPKKLIFLCVCACVCMTNPIGILCVFIL
jgi:hypothetical protein